jgi:hypothetical protein
LSDNWEEWGKILKSSNKTSMDYSKTLTSVIDAVRNLTGATDDFDISSEFVQANLTKIEAAAKGDIKAINELGVALAESHVNSLTEDKLASETIMKHGITDSEDKTIVAAGSEFAHTFDENKKTVLDGIREL